jgi:hypothetical protein
LTGATLPGTVGLPFSQSFPVQELDVVVVVVVVVVVPPLRPAPPDPDPDPVADVVVEVDPALGVLDVVGDVAVPPVVVSVAPVLIVCDVCVLVRVATLAVVGDLPEPPHAETPAPSTSAPMRAASSDRRRPRTMPGRVGGFTADPRAPRARA